MAHIARFKEMHKDAMAVITNPAIIKSEFFEIQTDAIKSSQRKKDGQLKPAAQHEMSLRGDRTAFVEFHRFMFLMSDIEVHQLHYAMKQFVVDEQLSESDGVYCDQQLLKDAIDYQLCLRNQRQFFPEVCEDIARSFKDNVILANNFPEIDSVHLITFAKDLIDRYSIEKIRLKLNLSINEMARACNVHRQTLVKWERAEREPGDAVKRLINILLWLKSKNLLQEYLETFDRFSR